MIYFIIFISVLIVCAFKQYKKVKTKNTGAAPVVITKETRPKSKPLVLETSKRSYGMQKPRSMTPIEKIIYYQMGYKSFFEKFNRQPKRVKY